MPDLSQLKRLLRDARKLSADLMADPHSTDLQIRHDAAWEKVDQLLDENLVCIGVGDGTGKLFVYGNYDSVKTCQQKLFE